MVWQVDPPSVILQGDKCELEVKEVAPSEMVSHVLVVVEEWFPCALIVLPTLRVHYKPYHRLVMRVM